jgi:hypothetical protein
MANDLRTADLCSPLQLRSLERLGVLQTVCAPDATSLAQLSSLRKLALWHVTAPRRSAWLQSQDQSRPEAGVKPESAMDRCLRHVSLSVLTSLTVHLPALSVSNAAWVVVATTLRAS